MVCGLRLIYNLVFKDLKISEPFLWATLFSGVNSMIVDIKYLLSSWWSYVGCSRLTEDGAGVWPGAGTDTTAPGPELRQLCLSRWLTCLTSHMLKACYTTARPLERYQLVFFPGKSLDFCTLPSSLQNYHRCFNPRSHFFFQK